ncbi:glycosyltransferase [Peijinzhouia sedimentorum]
MKYAAFIMTYKREEILQKTIEKLLAQSLPPSKILIVDNDPDCSAKLVWQQLTHPQIAYHSVGYNSGPAGAAFHGLNILFEEGWEWVLWMDDDDPPLFKDSMEELFNIPQQYSEPTKIGMLGAVGVLFDAAQAKTIRLDDDQLQGIIEVDNIAGSQLPLIHRRVWEAGILPSPELFFGFEELDFSLAIKRAGFNILVSGENLHRHREYANRLNFSRGLYAKKDIQKLWREYYTLRNLIHILIKKEKNWLGVFRLWFKGIFKSIYGFRYGFAYGWLNLQYLHLGFWHGFTEKLGNTIMPPNSNSKK